MIELRNVIKKFAGRMAVDDLSFTVPRGEISVCSATTARAKAPPSA